MASAQPNPAQPNPASSANTVALVGFIVGVATVIAVVLRPYWLISDVLGAAAIALGIVGLTIANRSGVGRHFSIWSIVLGLTPLIPLVLVFTSRLDYY